MTLATVVLAAFLVQAQTAGGISADERKDGFVPLFDGASLTGWQTIPLGSAPGTWEVRDGVLTHTPGDSWIATVGTYTDFILRLEYRTGKDTDSGIFLRSTARGYPSFTGMEIEIRSESATPPTTQSNTALYGAAAPRVNAAKAEGAWNVVEISVIKRHLVAVLNGQTIHDLDLDDAAYAGAVRGSLRARASSGHVGFQAHLTGTPVEFRAIRLKVVR